MRRLMTVLFGVMLGGGIIYIAFEYHVVRTSEGLQWIPKRQPGLTDPYVDIRDWKAAQWREHAVLSENLVASGHGHLVGGSLAGGLINDFVAPFLKEAPEPSRTWWNSKED